MSAAAPADDLKPFAQTVPLVATVEEHYVCGGLGSMVSELAGECGAHCRIIRFGVTDDVPRMCGNSLFLRERVGLTPRASH